MFDVGDTLFSYQFGRDWYTYAFVKVLRETPTHRFRVVFLESNQQRWEEDGDSLVTRVSPSDRHLADSPLMTADGQLKNKNYRFLYFRKYAQNMQLENRKKRTQDSFVSSKVLTPDPK